MHYTELSVYGTEIGYINYIMKRYHRLKLGTNLIFISEYIVLKFAQVYILLFLKVVWHYITNTKVK